MKEDFIKEFTSRASEHLQSCFRPGIKLAQIYRIIHTQIINASVTTGYEIYQTNILEPNLGEVTVLINSEIEVILPLENRKEADHA